jgi:hypothetical protein
MIPPKRLAFVLEVWTVLFIFWTLAVVGLRLLILIEDAWTSTFFALVQLDFDVFDPLMQIIEFQRHPIEVVGDPVLLITSVADIAFLVFCVSANALKGLLELVTALLEVHNRPIGLFQFLLQRLVLFTQVYTGGTEALVSVRLPLGDDVWTF